MSWKKFHFVEEHSTNIVKLISITITGHLSRNRTETDSLTVMEERIFFMAGNLSVFLLGPDARVKGCR